MSTFFNRFDKSWATSGIVIDPTDAQANAGFAYLGPVPPSVEGFNAMFQWNDDKDNWLFNQITNVIESIGGPVTETGLDALLNAINSKIAANNPAGIYLPLTGGTLAGPGNLIVSGPLEARSGRILSTGATTPSVALNLTGATPFSAGVWLNGSSIKIGVTNSSGLPTTEWATFVAGSMTYAGSISATGDVNVSQTLRVGSSGAFYVSDDVTSRSINWASGYFDKYTTSSGQRSWSYPGGAMTLTNLGVLTVANHQKVGGWGINYYPVDASNYIGFGWDGTNANFYVNGTWQSALALTGRYVAKSGDTMTGDLRAPHFIASTFVEAPIIQTPGVAAFMQGDTMRANTFVTAAQEPYAYMQGAGIYAKNRIDCGGIIYAAGDVNAGGAWVGDLFMHADANATYLNFNSSRYFNYERATGNLLYWVAPGTAWHKWTNGGSLEMALDQAWKPGTNTWGVISDDRVKKEHFVFRKGLNEVIALRPIVFSYTDEHGFEGTIDPRLETLRDEDNVPEPPPFNNLKTQIESRQRYVGLSAQETEKVFPEMISKRVAQFNGQVVTDLRGINNNELQYAFINAFKEINQRLIILEGEPK